MFMVEQLRNESSTLNIQINKTQNVHRQSCVIHQQTTIIGGGDITHLSIVYSVCQPHPMTMHREISLYSVLNE